MPSYVDARLDIDTPDRTLKFQETADQWSGEARLVYKPAGDRVQAVGGVYGFRRTAEGRADGAFPFETEDELSTAAVFGEATTMLWGPFGVILGGRL